MKKTRKIVLVVLCAALVLALLPVSALAQEQLQEAKCVCEALCTADEANADCTVCATDMLLCEGQATEETATIASFDAPVQTEYEVDLGTSLADVLALLPTTLTAQDAQGGSIKIENVSWNCADYNGELLGEYTFTAKLPEGTILAENLALPTVTVFVEGMAALRLFATETIVNIDSSLKLLGLAREDGDTWNDYELNGTNKRIPNTGAVLKLGTVVGSAMAITIPDRITELTIEGLSAGTVYSNFVIKKTGDTPVALTINNLNMMPEDIGVLKVPAIQLTSGSTLILSGTNKIIMVPDNQNPAVAIPMGGNLTIDATDDTSKLIIDGADSPSASAIGALAGSTFGTLAIKKGTFEILTTSNSGACIGGSESVTGGEIVIGTTDTAPTISAQAVASDCSGAVIGSGKGGSTNITINNMNVGDDGIKTVGTGATIGGGAGSSGGNITVYSLNLISGGISSGGDGAGIGGGQGGTGGNITIYNMVLDNGNILTGGASGGVAAGVGGGRGGAGGKITIYNIVTNGTAVIKGGSFGGAGIGGGGNSGGVAGNGGNIAIYGGNFTTRGTGGGAGIGGGGDPVGTAGDGGIINIYGGTIQAEGGKNAAGIGGGKGVPVSGSGGNITIHAGTITALGDSSDITQGGGAGIGGAGGPSKTGVSSGGNGGIIIINGGTVTAIGANNAAGIGGGGADDDNPDSKSGDSGSITINGGIITATGGVNGAAIGGGGAPLSDGGSAETITITGGQVTATGGANGAGIGGGGSGKAGIHGGSGGTIRISSATLTAQKNTIINATGGADAPGIGGGRRGAGADITMLSGTVVATSAMLYDIGAGDDGPSAGTLTISGGSLEARVSGLPARVPIPKSPRGILVGCIDVKVIDDDTQIVLPDAAVSITSPPKYTTAFTDITGMAYIWPEIGSNHSLDTYLAPYDPDTRPSGEPTPGAALSLTVPLGKTAPNVLSLAPQGENTNHYGDIVLQFDEPMDSTVKGTVTLNGTPLTGAQVWQDNNYTVKIPYGELFILTDYTVNASGFKDLSQMEITAESTQFKTKDEDELFLTPANQSSDGSTSILFQINKDYDGFTGAEVRNVGALTAGKDFKAWSGSTYVELLPEYIRTLKPGTYELDILFTDRIARTTFIVKEADAPSPPPTPPAPDGGNAGGGTGSGTTGSNTSPQTGDDANIALWVVLCAIAAGAVVVMATRRKKLTQG